MFNTLKLSIEILIEVLLKVFVNITADIAIKVFKEFKVLFMAICY